MSFGLTLHASQEYIQTHKLTFYGEDFHISFTMEELDVEMDLDEDDTLVNFSIRHVLLGMRLSLGAEGAIVAMASTPSSSLEVYFFFFITGCVLLSSHQHHS
jgi:hypothetical protein